MLLHHCGAISRRVSECSLSHDPIFETIDSPLPRAHNSQILDAVHPLVVVDSHTITQQPTPTLISQPHRFPTRFHVMSFHFLSCYALTPTIKVPSSPYLTSSTHQSSWDSRFPTPRFPKFRFTRPSPPPPHPRISYRGRNWLCHGMQERLFHDGPLQFPWFVLAR